MRERGILLMLATLLLLMPAVTFADTRAEETDIVYPEDVGGEPGDIVLIAYNYPECMSDKWAHAQIYLGNYSINDGSSTGGGNFADADKHKVVEATFHSEEWSRICNLTYHWIALRAIKGWGLGMFARLFLERLQQNTYSEKDKKWGGVEINNLTEGLVGKWHRIWRYCYGRVNMSKVEQIVGVNISEKEESELRKAVMNYGIQRANKTWLRLGYIKEVPNNKTSSRPFDYLSPWYYDRKQMDELTVEQVNNDPSLARTLKYGYYCSELVWAAWMHAGIQIIGKPIDLDGNNTTKAVFPWDIWESDLVDWYYMYSYDSSDDSSDSSNVNDEETLNLTLYYPDQTINVTGVICDIFEINGTYVLKTINNETYPVENLTYFELYTVNETNENTEQSSENETTSNETTGNETANSEESSSEENSSNDNSNSEDNSSNDQSNSEDNSDSNQDSSNEDDNSSSDDDQSGDNTTTGEQSSSEQSQNG